MALLESNSETDPRIKLSKIVMKPGCPAKVVRNRMILGMFKKRKMKTEQIAHFFNMKRGAVQMVLHRHKKRKQDKNGDSKEFVKIWNTAAREAFEAVRWFCPDQDEVLEAVRKVLR